MRRTIIDVSEHQGRIDWELAKPHIDGAILRCGFGSDIPSQDDEQFKRNADECTRLGIPFGVYLYSYAENAEMAKSEAAHVLRVIKGYKLSYPVYLDLEEKCNIPRAVEIANAFGDIIEAAGYWCGVYSSTFWWNGYLKGLDRFTKWVAQWYLECEYKGSYLDMWQYTSKGAVAGIRGNVDMNECYRDFPSEIVGTGVVRKTNAELAREVFKGLWGNGADRKARLTAAGYDYEAVQAIVNETANPEKKSNADIADEVMLGLWGVGLERKQRLTAAGYDYAAVQDIVNRKMQ